MTVSLGRTGCSFMSLVNIWKKEKEEKTPKGTL